MHHDGWECQVGPGVSELHARDLMPSAEEGGEHVSQNYWVSQNAVLPVPLSSLYGTLV